MVEPKVGLRVRGYGAVGAIDDVNVAQRVFHVNWDAGGGELFNMPSVPNSAWSKGEIGPLDEQPKPPEPWAPKVGSIVWVRGELIEHDYEDFGRPYRVDFDGDELWLGADQVHRGPTAPPQAESKRDTLPAPPHCPHCADNAGMLDAACKRLGEREVEHAAALRAVDRLTAELRDERNRRRYR